MTIKQLFQKHPNVLVLATPKLRDASNNFAKSWIVLQTASNVPDCEKALNYYEENGYEEVVIISTFTEESFSQVPEIPTRLIAKFWRVYFGTEGRDTSLQ